MMKFGLLAHSFFLPSSSLHSKDDVKTQLQLAIGAEKNVLRGQSALLAELRNLEIRRISLNEHISHVPHLFLSKILTLLPTSKKLLGKRLHRKFENEP